MTDTIKLYRPGSATQGESFISGWCGRCKHDRVTNGTVHFDDAVDDDYCQILGKTFLHDIASADYPQEWRYDSDGCPVCISFEPMGAPDGLSVAVRDDYTADLF